MAIKKDTDCVICGNPGFTTRFVKKVNRNAWVCRRHRHKD